MGDSSLLKGNAIFEKYIRKNFLKYLFILTVYLVGFLVGIGIFNKNVATEENASNISKYVIEKLENISLNSSDVISSYIRQDVLELILISILSFSIIGIPIIMIFVFGKSISLGVTVSALIHSNGVGCGLSFSILIFMIPTIIKILVVLLLVCSSIKFIENILKYRKEVKYELVRHAFTNLLAFLAVCIIIVYRTFSLNIVNQVLF